MDNSLPPLRTTNFSQPNNQPNSVSYVTPINTNIEATSGEKQPKSRLLIISYIIVLVPGLFILGFVLDRQFFRRSNNANTLQISQQVENATETGTEAEVSDLATAEEDTDLPSPILAILPRTNLVPTTTNFEIYVQKSDRDPARFSIELPQTALVSNQELNKQKQLRIEDSDYVLTISEILTDGMGEFNNPETVGTSALGDLERVQTRASAVGSSDWLYALTAHLKLDAGAVCDSVDGSFTTPCGAGAIEISTGKDARTFKIALTSKTSSGLKSADTIVRSLQKIAVPAYRS